MTATNDNNLVEIAKLQWKRVGPLMSSETSGTTELP